MKKGAVIAVIVIVVLLIAGIAGFFVMKNMDAGSPGQVVNRPSGSGLGFEDDQSDVVKKSSSGISIPGWKEITIDAGTTEVYVDFYNPQSNEGKVHMTFELKLAGTGEVLYTSRLVRAGDHIKQITLTRALDRGTYDAVLHVQPYTADETMTPTNNADINLKLIAG